MRKLFISLKRHVLQLVMTFFLFLTPLFFPFSFLHAEDRDLQQLFDSAESEANLEQLVNLIENLKTKNISLNQADSDELRQLPWLTTFDVQAILSYRRDKGPILSLETLEPILGKEKTTAVAPYILLNSTTTPPSSALSTQNSALSFYSRLRWETTERKGIITGAYSGDNYKLNHRLQFSARHFDAGFVQEKDIGEPDIADFSSLSIRAYDFGVIKNAVIGNYRLNFGEGVLIGQSRTFSKGSEPIKSVQLLSKQISGYTSSSESGFLQGAATTLKLDHVEVTSFYSANHVDAVINKTSGLITSFDESGNHRTSLETSRKDNVIETLTGANLLYRYQTDLLSAKLGGTLFYYNYSQPLAILNPQPSALSTQNSALCYSIQADASLDKVNLFAEAAFSEKPNEASWIAGSEFEIVKGVSMIASLRRYGTYFYSPFSGAFAERGVGASNEQGDYVGIKAKVNNRLSVGAYYDLFTFPLLDDHCLYPSDGNDCRVFMTWKQSPFVIWNLELQHKYKEEQANQGSTGNPLWTALRKITDRSRLDCDVDVSRRVHLRSRGEVKKVVNKYQSGDSALFGWLIYQQAGYHVGTFSLKGRVTMFDSDDYDAALYAYEDDLPLTSTLGLYNGRGKSLFILASWQAMQGMKLAVRYDMAWYSDRDLFGSGNDERATSSPGSFHLGCLLSF